MPRADREPLADQLLRVLRRGPHSTSQLVALTGRHDSTIRATLHRMRDSGRVRMESGPVAGRGTTNWWAINA